MSLLIFFALFFQQTTQPPPPDPPLPPRAYQPTLVDPGFDGERLGSDRNGELTPDGKVLIMYRNTRGPGEGTRVALVAAVVRPERLNTNSHGYLQSFYDYDGTTADDFTFGKVDIDPPAAAEQKVIHYMWVPRPPPNECDQDPDYPIEGNPHITIALRPLPTGNPYQSDSTGNPQNGGPYSCYKIWVLRLHSPGFAPYIECTGSSTGEPLHFVEPPPDPPYVNPEYRLVCQNITVVIDEAARQVVHATLDSLPFEDLHVGGSTGPFISGFEPSVTADGKLVLYHGDADGVFNPGDGNVTYIYNPNGPQATGWTPPRSITQLPTFPGTPAEQAAAVEAFKRRYRLFAQPIRMPPISVQGGGYPYDSYIFQPTDTVRGLYLWVSKDGSFFLAACAGATESVSDIGSVPPVGPRTRAGNYICGDITGGYIKFIDDVGINPTRRGGPWNWPPRQAASLHDSWRTMQFSTGLKPGLWEPLPGEGAPLPTQIASTSIPVLPVFESSIDSYGEVRCEELDGNYLLYLACNESLMLNDELADYEQGPNSTRTPVPGECDVIFDTRSTPDTSGRPMRARCTLNNGAAFPQEVIGDSATLRSQIGAELGPGLGLGDTVSLHECVGFKGQAIVFNDTGNVVVVAAPTLAGRQRFTMQLFVKVLGTPTTTLTLLEWGGASGTVTDPVVTIQLNTQGKFIASVSTTQGNLSTQSRLLAVPFNRSMANSRTGWRHVAITFDGSSNSESRLKLYLDGQLEDTSAAGPVSQVRQQIGAWYYAAGPGRTTANVIDNTNKLLILDEIAVSNVVRTTAELRRDAYVPALPGIFGSWPNPGPSLPMELDISEAHWPSAVAYDPDIVALGRDLFDDGILSLSGTGKCSQCHIPAEHFADQGQPVVPGVLNNPTLFNAAFGTHKLFDGSAASLEDQAWRPILGAELGPQTVADVLARINDPSSAFDTRFTDPATFGEPADQENVAQAIAMYIRTLNSGGSAWDNELYARAHGGVHFFGLPLMNAAQRAGAGLFFGKARCSACHRGTSFTDDDFHNVLTVETSEGSTFRGGFTGRVKEDGRVKTPTLRNVQHTGPYFHDGSKATLHDVILHYNSPPFTATGLVGTGDIDLRPLDLTTQEMSDLEAFLSALSGTIP